MSAPEPTLALVFSPEPWVEDLHRHLSHHGGARVRQVVVEPSVALEEDYEVLVVSDRWPALTFGFVGAVHARGRCILGVYDPEEPAGKDHLLALGVDATLAADAGLGEFVAAVGALLVDQADAHGVDGPELAAPATDVGSGLVVGVGGPRGSGVTEVALGVAGALTESARSVVLVDAHESAPAVAGRLGLALEPNLRTAVDACAHGLGTFADCAVRVAARRGGHLDAVAGHPSALAAAQVTTHDVLDVVRAARAERDVVVVDLDEGAASAAAVLAVADAVVAVVHASPVGVVRGLAWTMDAIGRAPAAPVHVVVNHAPRSRFRQAEIRTEVERCFRPTSLAWCPHDAAVESAAWDGVLVPRGAFRSECARVADAIAPDHGRPGRWRR